MNITLKKLLSRITASVVILLFGVNMVLVPVSFAQVAYLPVAGTMVNMTPKFDPMVVKGIKLYTDNPFKFDLIVDTGDMKLNRDQIKDQGQKLASYFLASLTTPEKEMWVNLSPYEKSRIIPTAFGDTEMGKELLSEDYMLKQIMATALYPERQLGKEFWAKVYNQAEREFGTTNVPVSTYNKVWIVPNDAVVYENAKLNSVFVVQSNLKVMLEQDYLAANKHKAIEQYGMSEDTLQKSTTNDAVATMSSRIIKQIVIPALEKEVNEGKNFAGLRQVYQSLILAAWYKKNLTENVLAKGYVDRNKTLGIDTQDKQITEKIYQQYLKAYRKGAYNYIKEEVDPSTQQIIPKKYFSGGFVGNVTLTRASANQAQLAANNLSDKAQKGHVFRIAVTTFALMGGAVGLFSTGAQAAGYGTFLQEVQKEGQVSVVYEKDISSNKHTAVTPQNYGRISQSLHTNDIVYDGSKSHPVVSADSKIGLGGIVLNLIVNASTPEIPATAPSNTVTPTTATLNIAVLGGGTVHLSDINGPSTFTLKKGVNPRSFHASNFPLNTFSSVQGGSTIQLDFAPGKLNQWLSDPNAQQALSSFELRTPNVTSLAGGPGNPPPAIVLATPRLVTATPLQSPTAPVASPTPTTVAPGDHSGGEKLTGFTFEPTPTVPVSRFNLPAPPDIHFRTSSGSEIAINQLKSNAEGRVFFVSDKNVKTLGALPPGTSVVHLPSGRIQLDSSLQLLEVWASEPGHLPDIERLADNFNFQGPIVSTVPTSVAAVPGAGSPPPTKFAPSSQEVRQFSLHHPIMRGLVTDELTNEIKIQLTANGDLIELKDPNVPGGESVYYVNPAFVYQGRLSYQGPIASITGHTQFRRDEAIKITSILVEAILPVNVRSAVEHSANWFLKNMGPGAGNFVDQTASIMMVREREAQSAARPANAPQPGLGNLTYVPPTKATVATAALQAEPGRAAVSSPPIKYPSANITRTSLHTAGLVDLDKLGKAAGFRVSGLKGSDVQIFADYMVKIKVLETDGKGRYYVSSDWDGTLGSFYKDYNKDAVIALLNKESNGYGTHLISQPRDHAQVSTQPVGGIDLEKLFLNTKGSGVRTAFSDPRILQMLLDAKGLFPQVQSIVPVTVPMVDMLLGFNTGVPANDNQPVNAPNKPSESQPTFLKAAFIDIRNKVNV
jgi:ribosomal protein L21E